MEMEPVREREMPSRSKNRDGEDVGREVMVSRRVDREAGVEMSVVLDAILLGGEIAEDGGHLWSFHRSLYILDLRHVGDHCLLYLDMS